jgi:CheY-like chemotaxis protein
VTRATWRRRHFGLRFMRERSDFWGPNWSSNPAGRAARVVRLRIKQQGRGVEQHGMRVQRAGPPARRAPTAAIPDQRTKILLVDDHALFRVGMRQILEREADFDIVGEAETRVTRSACAVRARPTSSCSTCRCRRRAASRRPSGSSASCPSTGIIALAVEAEDEDQLFEAIKAGAAAFILKDISPDDLVTIIRRVRPAST